HALYRNAPLPALIGSDNAVLNLVARQGGGLGVAQVLDFAFAQLEQFAVFRPEALRPQHRAERDHDGGDSDDQLEDAAEEIMDASPDEGTGSGRPQQVPAPPRYAISEFGPQQACLGDRRKGERD